MKCSGGISLFYISILVLILQHLFYYILNFNELYLRVLWNLKAFYSDLSEHRYKKETTIPAAAGNSVRLTHYSRFYREMMEKTNIEEACTSEKKKHKTTNNKMLRYIINKESTKQPQTIQVIIAILH